MDRHVPRQTSALTLRPADGDSTLPEGVFVRHPQGTREKIFWIHTLSLNLAKEFGHDQPFLFVTLTPRDMYAFGKTPTVQSIAACIVGKILIAQADGPYTIGGVCIGGLLAYEVAVQLKAAGREVSLLVLMDAPCQPYLKSYKSLSQKILHPVFFLQKAVQLYPRRYVSYVGRRLLSGLLSKNASSPETERDLSQEMIENAAVCYYPEKYDGKVLLLLPEQSVPRLNFLLGWQSVVPQFLNTCYVDGPHRNFITLKNVRTIASIIKDHLPQTSMARAKATSPASSMLQETGAVQEYGYESVRPEPGALPKRRSALHENFLEGEANSL